MQNNGTLIIFSDMLNSIAQLTKMLIKQQLTGAEKRTYTHLEEKVELQNQAGLVNRNIKKELCFCVTALL